MSSRFRRTQRKDDVYPDRVISSVQLIVANSASNEQCSVMEVTEKELYSSPSENESKNNILARIPRVNGPLDRRMGTSNYESVCDTCHQNWDDCPGHYGCLSFSLPVYNWGYFKSIIRILQCVCKSCSRLLLDDSIAQRLSRRKATSYLERKAYRSRIFIHCRKVKHCPHCGQLNSIVKKIGFMKLAHFKYRSLAKCDAFLLNQHVSNYSDAIETHRNTNQIINQGYEPLNCLDVFNILDKIRKEDVELLQMNSMQSHPRDLMLRNILAPPVPIRPSVVCKLTNSTTEDDITAKICELAAIKQIYESHEHPELVTHSKCLMITSITSWDYCQTLTALMMNSEISQIPSIIIKKDFIRGFAQRLKGKYGRFRGNLSGRRVNFSGRTVISPNPNLRIDEVSIPMLVAKILTFKDIVTPHNYSKLKELILKAGKTHPAAKFVTFKATQETKALQYCANKKEILDKLQFGDIVERELCDGDYVLFNRQPSLHRLSILCMKAKISKNRTFSFNECVCTPFNADFDGDEMNIHVPQTEEARVEAAILMDPKRNLVTPCNGQLIIGATQDFLSGIYLLTDKGRFFDREMTCQLIHSMMIDDVDLPPPAIMRPRALWTGKQLFSVLLAPSKQFRSNYRNLINLRCGSKSYKGTEEEFSVDDSYVVVHNSELVCGQIDKSLIGSGSKLNILYTLLTDCSEDYCAEVMWRIGRLAVSFLQYRGLSLGLCDVNAPSLLISARDRILKSGYEYCDDKAGFDEEAESLEATLNAKLSELRNTIGSECLKYLPSTNAPRIMSLSGSKGSAINVCQMITCVGQQTVNGGRIREDRYQARCLSVFPERSKDPAAYGFIENSFRTGLQPYDFFFHAMAGREGLVDTAVKTAETGYMQRRLVKCLEDLSCAYDGTVRSATGDIIQFKYGSDGLA